MKIPVKKYEMDESLSWEERYRQLERHHEEETTWMAGEIQRLRLRLWKHQCQGDPLGLLHDPEAWAAAGGTEEDRQAALLDPSWKQP